MNRIVCCVFVWLGVGSVCVGQTGGADDIRNAEQTHRESVWALNSFYKQKMQQLETEFVNEANRIRGDFLKSMESLRDTATKALDLETANKVEQKIKQITDTKIKLPGKDDKPATAPQPDFTGVWIGQWGTNSRSLRLEILDDNSVKMIDNQGKIQELTMSKSNDRYLVLKADHHELELIRQDDRLIVLGWSKVKDRHILVDPPNLMAILAPNR
jgi:hypothetical protein